MNEKIDSKGLSLAMVSILGQPPSRNVNKHYPSYAEENTEFPFAIAYEMRNALAHGYFKVDFEVVWKTVERDLPGLELMIEALLKQFE